MLEALAVLCSNRKRLSLSAGLLYCVQLDRLKVSWASALTKTFAWTKTMADSPQSAEFKFSRASPYFDLCA